MTHWINIYLSDSLWYFTKGGYWLYRQLHIFTLRSLENLYIVSVSYGSNLENIMKVSVLHQNCWALNDLANRSKLFWITSMPFQNTITSPSALNEKQLSYIHIKYKCDYLNHLYLKKNIHRKPQFCKEQKPLRLKFRIYVWRSVLVILRNPLTASPMKSQLRFNNLTFQVHQHRWRAGALG